MIQELIRQGRNGMCCVDVFKKLPTATDDELIDFYLRDPNYNIEKQYPDLNFLSKYCDNDYARSKGIYINQKLDNLICDKQVYIFNNCTGNINVIFNRKDKIFPMIYLGFGSNLDIIIDESRTPIYLFDNSSISIEIKNDARVTIYGVDGNIIKTENYKNNNINLKNGL